MKKLSKFGLITLILQTIATFGLNWLFFLIYYRLEKFAFLTNNKENEEVSNINLFFKKDVKALSIISISCYFLFLFILSTILLLSVNEDFFNILNFKLFDFVLSNIIYSILLASFIFILITYSYRIIIKSVYNTIYKNNNEYFNNYNDIDFIIFIVLSIISFGWLYILYLFTLGIYEFYLFMINKYVNKSKYNFSTFGIIAVFLIIFADIVLLYYIIEFRFYINPISIYLLLLFLISPLLNYGLYELKMRLFLNNRLNNLSKSFDYIFRPYINKKVILMCSIVVFVSLVISYNKIQTIKPIDYQLYTDVSIDNFQCQIYSENEICFNPNYDKDKNNYSTWEIVPIKLNDEYNYHKELVVKMINPGEINNEAILFNNNYRDFVFTSNEGEYFSNDNQYIYVQTYYKQLSKNKYIPLFNIIKSLEVINWVEDYNIHLSILENKVYIYDFVTQTFNIYDRNYHNIDTTRLMIDNLKINIESEKTNLYGYMIDSETTYLNVKPNNQEIFTMFLVHFDPFMFNEVIMHLYDSFNNLTENEIYNRDVIDLLTFKYFKNDQKISYNNDRFYLYMDNIRNISPYSKDTYINSENNLLIPCYEKEKDDIKKVFASSIEISNLTKQTKMLYTTDYASMFSNSDSKLISILTEGNKEFSGYITFSYEIKTIKQYFNQEVLKEVTLTTNT